MSRRNETTEQSIAKLTHFNQCLLDRALIQKRREMAELEESSRHLRAEVRSKKNSIAALEALLKDAGRNRRRHRSRSK
jgi:hypothetical protein